MKRKRDRDRDEERERGAHDLDGPFNQSDPDYSIIGKQEREDAELVLKHGLPANLVRELQAKGKARIYGAPRVSLSCTVEAETLHFIRQLGELEGVNQGRALDRLVKRIKGLAKEERESGRYPEKEESAVERSAKRRRG